MERKISDLYGKNIVVYDTEIKRPIDGKEVTWNCHDKMGISVACLFDYESGDTIVYLDDNIGELHKRLEAADLVVGFNTINFDHILLRATVGAEGEYKNYDLFQEMQASRNLNKFSGGCKLDDVLKATFCMEKTANGAEAPHMFQRGEMGKLISYCLADVRRERMVFEYAYLHGFIKTEKWGKHPMPCPLERIQC